MKWKFLPWYPKSPCPHVTLLLLTHTKGTFDLGYISKPYYFHLQSLPQAGCLYFSYFTVCVVCSVISLCNPTDCTSPESSVRGVFQARILGWVAISYSRGFLDAGVHLHWQADSLPCATREALGWKQMKIEPNTDKAGTECLFVGLPNCLMYFN